MLTAVFSRALSMVLRILREFGRWFQCVVASFFMIPGEQPDLSALPPETSPVKRRLAAQYVRDARDRLTSSSGPRPAFDYELLRQYAQNRRSASLVILLLVATIGFLSSLWSGAVAAGAWA